VAAKSVVAVRQLRTPGDLALMARGSEPSGPSGKRGTPPRFNGDAPDERERVGLSIAIVDDEKDLSLVFSLLIRSLGYHTEFIAHDGTEIVEALTGGSIHPDLILMDHRMPMMDGLQAAETIKRMMPKVRILIASADDSIAKSATSAGFFFIQKPFSKSSLAKAIKEALDSCEAVG
jgi:CheY-like chemotaxis protein